MKPRHTILALLMGVVMLLLVPSSISAATPRGVSAGAALTAPAPGHGTDRSVPARVSRKIRSSRIG